MTLTVGEVIDLPVLQAGRPEVLSARRWDEQIRWVHVSDVADLSALLQGGELVLTTGAALRKVARQVPARRSPTRAHSASSSNWPTRGAAGRVGRAALPSASTWRWWHCTARSSSSK